MADIPSLLRILHPDWPDALVTMEAATIATELADFRADHETPG